ncbi:MAG: sulfatase family protein [Actinomycetota bacterium]
MLTKLPHPASRLRLTVTGVVTTVVMVLGFLGCNTRPAAKAAVGDDGRPNILIIVTDDQRMGTMSVMPQTRRLFERGGVSFTNAFATTPLCCPSRSSIMTGRYAHNHGVVGNGMGDLLNQDITIQRYIHSAGYKTGVAGKFLNGWQRELDPPHFDKWAVMFHPRKKDPVYHHSEGYYNGLYNVNGELNTIHRYSTDQIVNHGLSFLEDFEKNDDQPWYLYVAPFGPHKPYTAEPAYSDRAVPQWNRPPSLREQRVNDKPSWVYNHSYPVESAEALRRAQMRTLMSIDDLVSKFFARMDALGETRDTLAIFLSDNGYMWGEHGLKRKQHPYTESVQVPFFLRWPGKVAPGSQDDRIAATIDIAPTILEAAGMAPNATMDGSSLLGPVSREVLLIEYWHEPKDKPTDWASLRSDTFQYIEYYNDHGRIVFREYYDLVSDPFQMDNTLRDGKKRNDPRVDALSTTLANLKTCSGRTCP